MKRGEKETTIEIAAVPERTLRVNIVGTTPFVCNRMSEKVKQGLLLPKGKKTTAEKASTQKHEPRTEFRSSPYRLTTGPTLLGIPGAAFKRSMANAALVIPGAKKAEIGRLCWVNGMLVPLFGLPELFMAVTRSADIARTPDVRTRAIIPAWASVVEITFGATALNETAIANLLTAAGKFIGVGDGRQEKGALNFGQFRIANDDDPELKEILATGGRQAQTEALAAAKCHDDETQELLDWYDVEVQRRGFKVVA